MVNLIQGGNIVSLALSHQINVVAHCCNCRATFTGVSIAIGNQWPKSVLFDNQKFLDYEGNYLGTILSVHFRDETVTVVNCYTQLLSGSNHNKSAFTNAMITLEREYGRRRMRIGIAELTAEEIDILRNIFTDSDINVII